MNTFLWLKDYQWNAISSIATTIGVLTALFIPLLNKRKEKRNLVYFQRRAMRKLLRRVINIRDAYELDGSSDKRTEVVLNCIHQYALMEVQRADIENKELAKYDHHTYEIMMNILGTILETKRNAKVVLQFKEQFGDRVSTLYFDESIIRVHALILLNYKFLVKKGIFDAPRKSRKIYKISH